MTAPAHAPPRIAYQSKRATLWHGRSEDVLPTMAAHTVELLLTDPPYGVENESNRRRQTFGQIEGDRAVDRETVQAVLAEALRVLRLYRHLYVFGPQGLLAGLPIAAPVELIWDKVVPGSGDVTSTWAPAHEPITFSSNRRSQPRQVGASSIPARLRRGSVLSYQRPHAAGVRAPNEKPVGLCRELVESSSRQGETVLDPFAGTCSTGVAAILSGRSVILIESDQRWIDLGIPRLRAAERLADEAAKV